MKALRIIAWALALVLATTAHADAAPIAAAFAAIAGLIKAGGIIGSLIQLAIGLALNFGMSLLLKALQKKPPEQGVRLQIEIGDDHPGGFVVGEYATAGTRAYAGSYGLVGKTPNALLIDVIQLGDLPAPGLPGVWVNGEKVTVLWNEPYADGFCPVLEYRASNVDHLWVRYNDGTQTAPDAFLRDTFGSDPDRPWEDDMIGRGVPYVVMRARVNRDLFKGGLNWLFEPPSIGFYDIRKDSTAGGSGAHRWNDLSTREPSTNPAVIAYNILRGIYYDDGTTREWMFGGQNLPAFRLPAANWMAAMNECDAPIDLEGGGTEPQYRCGYEIRCDMDPLDVVEELLKGFGRVAEVGGRFKIHVGAPGAPVYSFTDGDVLVTEGQGFQPFLPLSDTVNGIEATAPFPGEAWRMRDVPALYDEDMEEEDGGRRLAVGVQFPAAPYHVQCQRVMKSMLQDGRRQRVHVLPMPPDASLLEPAIDVVAWTSARNGYINKKFTVERVSGRRTRCPVIIIREVDPSDYDWSPGDQQPIPPPVWTGPIRPPVQPMTGWSVEPYIVPDSDGEPRRPGIKVFYDGDQDDVRAVRIKVWEDFGGNNVVFDGEVPYGPVADGLKSQVLSGNWTLPNEDYEVEGIFLPFSGRLTEWSSRLPVKTPNVLLGGEDFYPIDLDQFKQDVKDFLEWTGAGARAAFDETRALALQIANLAADDATERAFMRRELSVEMEGARASFEELIALEVGPDSALGLKITALEVELDGKASAATLSATQVLVQEIDGEVTALADQINILEASVGDVAASVTIRGVAAASPGGGYARWGVQVKVSGSTWDTSAGFFIDTHTSNPSRFVILADRTIVSTTGGTIAALFDGDTTFINKARIRDLTADQIDVANLVADTIFVANLTVDTLNLTPNAATQSVSVAGSYNGALGPTVNPFAAITAPAHTKFVNVYVNGTLTLQDLGSGAGTVTLRVYKNGSPSSILAPITIGVGSLQVNVSLMDFSAVAGDVYALHIASTTTAGTVNPIFSGTNGAIWFKR